MSATVRRKAFTALAATVAMAGALFAAPAVADTADDGPVEAPITVPKVEGMGEDWINGADFSSILSLEESGVTFQDFDGNEGDLFEILADAEVNWARVRVWNEPYRAENPEHGYGAGNVDADRATEIGVRATEAGMRVLVNFHYSDFWAHPGQQYVPRAWADTSPQERIDALYDYTVETLEQLKDAGVDVGMVQIGNETSRGEIAGTEGWDNTAALFSAGSQAVRDVYDEDEDVQVAVHFTNPERSGQYASVAKALDDRNVDYDVFLSSYYSFWHGTTENLTSVLNHVANTYDKDVAVAETSWAYTLEDGDGMENSVSSVNNPAYSISEQGQALAIRDVMQAVADVDDGRGLGTFYWEPAWLPVTVPEDGADRGELFWENWPIWQEHGAGWATSYSQDFYRPDPGYYDGIPEDEWADVFGGSGWDNQALFDWAGNPLESLRVYEYARTGSVAPRDLDGVESPSMTVVYGEDITLPETVAVTYTDGTTEQESVTWQDSTEWILGPGTYTVRGVTEAGHEVTATITVLSDANQGTNYVVNPGFEDGADPWTGEGDGYTISDDENPYEGSRSLHFWAGSDYSFAVEQVITDLPPGEYRLSAMAQGGDAGADDTMRITAQSGISTVGANFVLAGHTNWQNPVTDPITVGADGTATIRAELSLSGGAWGSMDNFAFVEVADDEDVDLSALQSLAEEAGAIDREDYTEDSVAVLDAALVRASFVLGSSQPAQESADAAAEQLEQAIEALQVRPVTFSDVPEGYAFGEEIAWLAQNGITTGWDDGTFRPLQAISREAMAAFLHRYDGSPDVTLPEFSPFSDVDLDEPYYAEIMWLADNGISTGWDDGTFRPRDEIARDAMAAFMYRFAGEPEVELPEVSPFADVDPGQPYYREIVWLYEEGISTGWDTPSPSPSPSPEGMSAQAQPHDPRPEFRPAAAIERQAMAAFLHRYDQLGN